MANAQYIQDKIYYGYDKAAQRLGFEYDIYHSVVPVDPINPANFINRLFASFNVSWNYEKANKYGNAVYQLVSDGRYFSIGDFFVGNGETWFVISKDLQLPITAVQCNHTVLIERSVQSDVPGTDDYSGYNNQLPDVVARNLPASILYANKGNMNPERLPTDTNLGFWTVLVPNLGNVIYFNRDIVQDENGYRYVVVTPELTDFGWRLMCVQAGT